MAYHHALACISSPKVYIISRRLYPLSQWWYTRLSPWWYTKLRFDDMHACGVIWYVSSSLYENSWKYLFCPPLPRKKPFAKADGFFQWNSFLTERVKYADAYEIACGSEIRLRRVKERILFHIVQSRRRREIFHNFRKEIISHSAGAEYFTWKSNEFMI